MAPETSKENREGPRGRPRRRNAGRTPSSESSSDSESPEPSVSGTPLVKRAAPFPYGHVPRGENFHSPPYPPPYCSPSNTAQGVVPSGANHGPVSNLPISEYQRAQHGKRGLSESKSPEPGAYMASPSRPSASGHDSERIPMVKAKSKASGNQQSVSKPPKLEQAKASRNHRSVSKSPDRKRAKFSQSQHSVLKTLETKGEKRTPNDCSPAASSSRSLTPKGAQSEDVQSPSQALSSSGSKPTSHSQYQPVESNEKISGKRAKNSNKNARSKLDSLSSGKCLSLDAQGKTLDKAKSVKEHKEDNQYSSDLEEDVDSSLESPPLLATAPDSDTNPPSPSACISSFSDLTLRMVKSLQIEVQTPPPPIPDLVYDDILINSATPVHMAMLPSLLRLVKESWKEPLALSPTSRRVENLYKIQGEEAGFLSKHLQLNSVMVEVFLPRSKTRNYTVPVTNEGRKLDAIGRRIYSASALGIKAANYQAAMAAYHLFLWEKLQPLLLSLPEDKRAQALTIQQEAHSLATHQLHSARHSTDCAAKSLSAAVALRRHAWLKSTGIQDYFKAKIEDLPFDGEGLFNEKTDDVLQKLIKMRSVAKRLSVSYHNY